MSQNEHGNLLFVFLHCRDMKKGTGCNSCTHPTCPYSLNSNGICNCSNCEFGVLVLDPSSGPKWKIGCNRLEFFLGLYMSTLFKCSVAKLWRKSFFRECFVVLFLNFFLNWRKVKCFIKKIGSFQVRHDNKFVRRCPKDIGA